MQKTTHLPTLIISVSAMIVLATLVFRPFGSAERETHERPETVLGSFEQGRVAEPNPAPAEAQDPAPVVASMISVVDVELDDPHLQGVRESFVDFDPGYGELIQDLINDGPSPSYEDIAREEEQLAGKIRGEPTGPGHPPDFHALGYASAEKLEMAIRHAFGIAPDRYVELREVEDEGRSFITIAVAPASYQMVEGSIASGHIHQLEPIAVARDGELEIAINSTGDADVYIAIGEEATESDYWWHLSASDSEDSAVVQVLSGETVYVAVQGGEQEGEYLLQVD